MGEKPASLRQRSLVPREEAPCFVTRRKTLRGFLRTEEW